VNVFTKIVDAFTKNVNAFSSRVNRSTDLVNGFTRGVNAFTIGLNSRRHDDVLQILQHDEALDLLLFEPFACFSTKRARRP
jgi:hypothetical protein